jgi:hypothetical protein
LACWWVGGEPLDPLLVHACEVGFFVEDDGGADDTFEGGACGLKDGGDVLQALAGLLLDGVSDELASGGIVRAGAGDEDEAVTKPYAHPLGRRGNFRAFDNLPGTRTNRSSISDSACSQELRIVVAAHKTFVEVQPIRACALFSFVTVSANRLSVRIQAE